MKNTSSMTNFYDYYRQKCLQRLGLIELDNSPEAISNFNLYVNSINDVRKYKLKEYKIWYNADSDNLLNFYTGGMLYEYNTEPFYDRNKRSYFWAVSATEDDIKRTHSCQPRNIVDTLVDIVGYPNISLPDVDQNKNLKKILGDNNFSRSFLQHFLPMTLVEGWGCYKIDFDKSFRNTPIIRYYEANEVDFIYQGSQVVSILFKNYYQDSNGQNYLLVESRNRAAFKSNTINSTEKKPALIIEKELFRVGEDNTMIKIDLKSLKELRDVEERLVINDYNGFLAVPSIIYESIENGFYGRSIYTGKIDLFDDLDQCLSQASNTVRRSTTRVYMNSNYLERDPRTGMPIQPSAYDCKYVLFNGGLGADGATGNQEPVSTIQPRLDFSQYSTQAVEILVQIVSGIMSPATLGIDIAKKDNAAAQREKEKVTIFTKKTICDVYEKILKALCSELMCCQELMNTGEIKKKEYDVNVKFSELSNDAFESRAELLLSLYNAGVMTPELFIHELYKDTLSEEEQARQIKYIEDQKAMTEMQQSGQFSAEQLGQMGAEQGGMANNQYDEMQAQIGEMMNG